eukprot:2318272-Prymnesium_polylepis.1
MVAPGGGVGRYARPAGQGGCEQVGHGARTDACVNGSFNIRETTVRLSRLLGTVVAGCIAIPGSGLWPMAYDAPGGGIGRYARPA